MMACDIARASPYVVSRMGSSVGVETTRGRVVMVGADVVGPAPRCDRAGTPTEQGDQAQSGPIPPAVAAPEEVDQDPGFAREDRPQGRVDRPDRQAHVGPRPAGGAAAPAAPGPDHVGEG